MLKRLKNDVLNKWLSLRVFIICKSWEARYAIDAWWNGGDDLIHVDDEGEMWFAPTRGELVVLVLSLLAGMISVGAIGVFVFKHFTA